VKEVLSNRQDRKVVLEDTHTRNIETHAETYDFIVDYRASEALENRDRVLIPDEVKGRYREFIINNIETDTYNGETEVFSEASYPEDLKKAKPIAPQTLEQNSPEQGVNFALRGTGWEAGEIEYAGFRTISWTSYNSPFDVLKILANRFDLVLDFTIETKGNKVTKRLVHLRKSNNIFKGKEIRRGKDLADLKRKTISTDIVTALVALAPQPTDETKERLVVEVKDDEAQAKWGKAYNYIWGIYEPESSDEEMTKARLTTLAKTELGKHNKPQVEYTIDAVTLSEAMPHESMIIGDKARIKDDLQEPYFYVDATVKEVKRSIFSDMTKTYTLGEITEHQREDLRKHFNSLVGSLSQRLASTNSNLDNVVTMIDKEVERRIYKQDTPPENPITDQLWLDTSNPQKPILKRYFNYQWNEEIKAVTEASDIGAITREQAMYEAVLASFENIKPQHQSIITEATELREKPIILTLDNAEIHRQNILNAISNLNTAYTNIDAFIESKKTTERISLDDAVTSNNLLQTYSQRIQTLRQVMEKAKIDIEQHLFDISNEATRIANENGEIVERLDTWRSTSFETDVEGISSRVGSASWTSEWKPAVDTDIKNAVDNIEVGGRNLLQNSTGWVNHQVDKIVNERPYRAIDYSWGNGYFNLSLDENTQYTLSVWAYNDMDTPQSAYILIQSKYSDRDGWQTKYETPVLQPKESKHIVLTINTGDYTNPTGEYRAYLLAKSGSTQIHLSYPKLEEGNKATSWTEAPEDTEARIEATNQELSELAGALGDFEETVNNTFRDGIIEEAEAKAIKSHKAQLSKEKKDIDQKYDTIRNHSLIVASEASTVRNNLTSAKSEFNTAHSDLVSYIDTAISNGKATEAEYNATISRFGTYEAKLATLSFRLEEANDYISSVKATVAETNAKSHAETKAQAAQEAAEKYALAQANAERVKAEAYADGKVTDEEKARIADVNAKLKAAKEHADTTSAAAEKAAKEHADTEIGNIQIGGRNLLPNSEIIEHRNHNSHYILTPTKAGQYTISFDYEIIEEISTITSFLLYSHATGVGSFAGVPLKTEGQDRTHLTFEVTENMIGSSIALYAGTNAATSRENKMDFIEIMIERGNKPTGWSPAPEDIDAQFNTINENALGLNSDLTDAFKDGIISNSEAKSIEDSLNTVKSDFENINQRYQNVYNNAKLSGSPKSNLYSAKVSFNSAYNSLVDYISSIITSGEVTDTQKSTYTSRYSTYRDKIGLLSDAIETAWDAITNQKVDDIEVGGTNLAINTLERINPLKNSGESSDNYNYEKFYSTDGLIAGDKYIISGFVEVTDGAFTGVSVYEYPSGSNKYVSIDPNTGYFESSFVARDGTDCVLVYNGFSGNTRGNGAIFRKVKLEKGNKATSWSPAPEDIEAQFNDVYTNAYGLNEDLTKSFKDGIISESEAKAIGGSLNSVRADFANMNKRFTSIYSNLKLSGSAKTNLYNAKINYNSAYNTLTGYISDINTSETITDSQKSTYNNYFGAYRSSIESLSEAMENALDAISTQKVDDVEIGSTNLLRNSREFVDAFPTYFNGKPFRNLGYVWGYNFGMPNGLPNLEEGQQYTVSILAHNNQSTQQRARIHGSYLGFSEYIYIQPNETKLLTHTFTYETSTNTQIIYFLAEDGHSIWYSYPKLEKGNKATDWSPAPEDQQKYADDAVDGFYKDTIQTNYYTKTATDKKLESYITDETYKGNLDSIATYKSTYNVNTGQPAILREANGSPFTHPYSYEVTARVTGTNTDTLAVAAFLSRNNGSTYELVKLEEKGQSSNHPEFFLDSNGQPAIRLYGHSSLYNVEVIYTKYAGEIGSIHKMNTTIEQTAKDVTIEAREYADGFRNNLIVNPTATGSLDLKIGEKTEDFWGNSSATALDTIDFKGNLVNALRIRSSSSNMVTSPSFKIDSSKAYEFSAWVKKSSSEGRVYIGFYGRDENDNSNLTGFESYNNYSGGMSSSGTGNPYFAYPSRGNSPTDWVQVKGYILPLGTETPMKELVPDLSGYTQFNFKMFPIVKQLQVRFLNYDNTSQQDMWVVNPMIQEVSEDLVKKAAQIKVQSDSISLQVRDDLVHKSNILSEIELSDENVKISGDKINLIGDVNMVDGKTYIENLSYDKSRGGTALFGGSGENGKIEVLDADDQSTFLLDSAQTAGSHMTIGELSVETINNPNLVSYSDEDMELYVRGDSYGNDSNSGRDLYDAFATLGRAIEEIPKIYDGFCTIWMRGTATEQEDIYLAGHTGRGTIEICGSTTGTDGSQVLSDSPISLNKSINFDSNLIRFNMRKLSLNNSAGSVVRVENSSVGLYTFEINGGGGNTGLYVTRNAYCEWRGGKCTNVHRGIQSLYGSRVYYTGVEGHANQYGTVSYYASTIAGSGSGITGDTANQSTQKGSITEGSWTYPSVSSPAPAPTVTTHKKTFNSSYADHYYHNSWGWNGTYMDGFPIQGQWSGYAMRDGAWFFGSTMRNTLQSKTIKKVRVYLGRTSYGTQGYTGRRKFTLRMHQHSSRPSGAPTFTAGTYTNYLEMGERKWFDVTSAFKSYINSGSWYGFGVSTNSTSNYEYMAMMKSLKVEVTYED
jgi:phage minor structural protein